MTTLLIKIFILARIFFLPFILYLALFVIRVNGYSPPVDAGFGDFIIIINFLFGAFIAYFVWVTGSLKIVSFEKKTELLFWLLASLLLTLLAFDEMFAIHENLKIRFGVPEKATFVGYGVALVAILALNIRNVSRYSIFFFGVFVVLGLAAVLFDGKTYYDQLHIGGREIDLEQFTETFSALSISCCIAVQALELFKRAIAGK